MYIHYDILYYGTEYKLQVCVLGTVLEYYSAVAHARRKKPNLTARSSGIVRVEGCERGGDRVPWGFNKALSSTRRRLDFYPLLLRTESQKRRGENLANWGSDDPVTNQSLGNSDEQGGSTEGHPRPPQDRMTDPWRDTRQARKGQKKRGGFNHGVLPHCGDSFYFISSPRPSYYWPLFPKGNHVWSARRSSGGSLRT